MSCTCYVYPAVKLIKNVLRPFILYIYIYIERERERERERENFRPLTCFSVMILEAV